jgi:hypothetical protein
MGFKFLVVVLLLSLVACTDDPAPLSTVTTTPGADQSTPEISEADSRAASIYAAVVRRLRKEANPSRRVFILDRTHANAARPVGRRQEERTPIPSEVQSEVLKRLAEFEVRFVSRDDEAFISKKQCAGVKKGGSLVTLGEIKGGRRRVQIGVGSFTACLSGLWLTYVVELRSDRWKVTGTTGPVAIS